MSARLTGAHSELWMAWSERRPTDTKATYRWRVGPRMICGAMLAPEWSDKLLFVGMGYYPSEWWPPFSNWDGYNRTVPNGLEWRQAGNKDDRIDWIGLNLLPCPFTGLQPIVIHKGRWIGAPPYEAESLTLRHYFGTSYGWTSPRLVEAWNRRVDPAGRQALAHPDAAKARDKGRQK